MHFPDDQKISSQDVKIKTLHSVLYVVSYSVVYLTYVGDQLYYIDLNQMKIGQTKEKRRRGELTKWSTGFCSGSHTRAGTLCLYAH